MPDLEFTDPKGRKLTVTVPTGASLPSESDLNSMFSKAYANPTGTLSLPDDSNTVGPVQDSQIQGLPQKVTAQDIADTADVAASFPLSSRSSPVNLSRLPDNATSAVPPPVSPNNSLSTIRMTPNRSMAAGSRVTQSLASAEGRAKVLQAPDNTRPNYNGDIDAYVAAIHARNLQRNRAHDDFSGMNAPGLNPSQAYAMASPQSGTAPGEVPLSEPSSGALFSTGALAAPGLAVAGIPAAAAYYLLNEYAPNVANAPRNAVQGAIAPALERTNNQSGYENVPQNAALSLANILDPRHYGTAARSALKAVLAGNGPEMIGQQVPSLAPGKPGVDALNTITGMATNPFNLLGLQGGHLNTEIPFPDLPNTKVGQILRTSRAEAEGLTPIVKDGKIVGYSKKPTWSTGNDNVTKPGFVDAQSGANVAPAESGRPNTQAKPGFADQSQGVPETKTTSNEGTTQNVNTNLATKPGFVGQEAPSGIGGTVQTTGNQTLQGEGSNQSGGAGGVNRPQEVRGEGNVGNGEQGQSPSSVQNADSGIVGGQSGRNVGGNEVSRDVGNTPEGFSTGSAVWQRPEGDTPVNVTGYLGEHQGQHYVSIEGSSIGIPLSEVSYPEKNISENSLNKGTFAPPADTNINVPAPEPAKTQVQEIPKPKESPEVDETGFRGDTPTPDKDLAAGAQMRMADTEQFGKEVGIDLPDKTQWRTTFDAVRDRAEANLPDLYSKLDTMTPEEMVNASPELRYAAIKRARIEGAKLTDIADQITNETDPKKLTELQARYEATKAQTERYATIAYKGNSDAGRSLVLSKMFVSGPFDTPEALKAVELAKVQSKGQLTKAQETQIASTAGKAKKAKAQADATIERQERIQKRGISASIEKNRLYPDALRDEGLSNLKKYAAEQKGNPSTGIEAAEC